MTSGDTHVANPLDFMHYEIDSMVHSYYAYKSVQSPIIVEQLILRRSSLANSHNELAVPAIKDSQVVSRIPL